MKRQREERLKEQTAAREQREVVDREKEMEMNDELTKKEDEALLFLCRLHPPPLSCPSPPLLILFFLLF